MSTSQAAGPLATYEAPEDWSYAWRSLLQVPDADRIEGHAVQLLSRALNIGRVVAFVGAGASMAYGRISWRDLVITMQNEALNKSSSDNTKALEVLLETQRIEPGVETKSEDFLAVFQLAEELDRARAVAARGHTDLFRKRVMELVIDGYGHAEQIVQGAAADVWADEKMPEKILLKKGRSSEFPSDDFRRREYFNRLVQIVGDDLRSSASGKCETGGYDPAKAKAALLVTMQSLFEDSDREWIKPYHRFAAGVLLRLVPKDGFETLESVYFRSRDDRPGRALLLSSERDPLYLTLKLGITRFLTTNYDREIEQLLNDDGFRHEVASGIFHDGDRKDPLGHPWRDVVFDRHHTGHLLAFAARNRSQSAEVVHLHGRAISEGQVDSDTTIVATEADYQERYAAEDERRSAMDDAMTATFAGNPILFLGSGMGEDDLLRPLRQFVGNEGRPGERLAVALVPSEATKEDGRAKIRNLQRYGVYTIHYGRATVECGQGEEEVPWLSHAHALRRKLDIMLNLIINKDDRNSRDYRKELDDVSKPLDPGEKTDGWILKAPKFIERQRVERYPGLNLHFEVEILTAGLNFARGLEQATKPEDEGWRLVAQAYRYAVAGAMDSIIGAFLCARLLRSKADWERWRQKWLALPDPIDPDERVKRWAESGPVPRILKRHAVVLPEFQSQEQEDEPQRFYAGAPSQTFNYLLGSLSTELKLRFPPKGRRLFLLIARRGVGKGHFFAALSGEARYRELLPSLGMEKADGASEGATLCQAAAFFNFSFSHELASVFDQLSAFLCVEGQKMFPHAGNELLRGYQNLRRDRIGRLDFILTELGKLATQPPPDGVARRLLVAFNGFSTLFDGEGRPKNAQFDRLYRMLVGGEGRNAPIDLFLICGETAIPLAFRPHIPPPAGTQLFGYTAVDPMTELRRTGLEQKDRIALNARVKTVASVPYETNPSAALARPVSEAYVHFLHEARATILVTAFFPSVALVVSCQALRVEFNAQAAEIARSAFKPTKELSIRKSVKLLMDNLVVPLAHSHEETQAPKLLFPQLLVAGAKLFDLGLDWEDGLLLPLIKQAESRTAPDDATTSTLDVRVNDVMPKNLKKACRENSYLVDRELRELYEAAGRSRFAFTLLMATAYQYLVPIAEDENGTLDDKSIRRAMDDAAAYLQTMKVTLGSLPFTLREDLIIEGMFQVMSTIHGARKAWPGASKMNPQIRKQIAELTADIGMPLFDLQQTLLWQLAVIGQPVTVQVLSAIPMVADAWQSVFKRGNAKTTDERTPGVEFALELLERRCLVFRIHPREPPGSRVGEPEWPGERRWAVHLAVQRNIFSRLRAPFVEYPVADQFTMTMYATQPNDVPRLTPAAHRDLHETVASLIGYPEAEREARAPYKALLTNGGSTVACAQQLRAALGIVRSVYSLATIARFEPAHRPRGRVGLAAPGSRRGFFEEHRLLVRWMLDQAKFLDTKIDDKSNPDISSRPFYAEEIVWLYNEAAVLSFVQGHMPDAVALFERADAAAELHLEPAPTGALRTRIRLNWALADIQRGQLVAADRALRQIRSLDDEHPVLPLIAEGYLGLIAHLQGRVAAAKVHYETAIGTPETMGLVALRRSRSAALISKHYGDLLATSQDYIGAETKLNQAFTLALEGGHADVRHEVLLSLVRLKIEKGYKRGLADPRTLHRQLDLVEAYSNTMGMSRLQCEVDYIRTDLRRRGGDLRAAATVASRGLAIAAANDLRLRKTSLLLQLAGIYVDQELHAEAQPLLTSALDIAQDTGFHSAFVYAQDLQAKIVPAGAGVAVR